MKSVVATGRTIEEAVEKALSNLSVSRDQVDVEVLEKPTRGFFGFIGSKTAKIEVIVHKSKCDHIVELLQDIFNKMYISVTVNIDEDPDAIHVNLEGENLGILIGRRGQTLDALQYIVNLAVNKVDGERKRVILNIEGYRERREETLQQLAFKLAEKAKRKHGDIVLEPMNSHERRIIHTALQGNPNVNTYSEGEDPYRKVIISYKK